MARVGRWHLANDETRSAVRNFHVQVTSLTPGSHHDFGATGMASRIRKCLLKRANHGNFDRERHTRWQSFVHAFDPGASPPLVIVDGTVQDVLDCNCFKLWQPQSA